MSTPKKVIRNCEQAFSGEWEAKSLGELQRWTASQLKLLAKSLQSRNVSERVMRHNLSQVEHVATGGLGLSNSPNYRGKHPDGKVKV